MLSLSKYFLTIFMGISFVFAVPPALNVYVIPFDNTKSEPALMWLSDAFSRFHIFVLSHRMGICLTCSVGTTRIASTFNAFLSSRITQIMLLHRISDIMGVCDGGVDFTSAKKCRKVRGWM